MTIFKRQKVAHVIIGLIIILVGFGFFNRGNLLDSVYSRLGLMDGKPTLVSEQTKTEIDKVLEKPQDKLVPTILANNQPSFKQSDLKVNDGSWQKLAFRDVMGRPGVANALLNKAAMPLPLNINPRERLTVKTPGYHVVRTTNGGYLYNRCHLIGYQLTGENNNPRNLVTGTRQLNAEDANNPVDSMQTYENLVAKYLEANPDDFVRYRVRPIYKNIERVPRGVEMEGQSIKTSTIHFHIFIPNVQRGYEINYLTGYSHKGEENVHN